MAYETGTASNIGDLMSKLRTFLLAEGFTWNAGWTSGSYSVGVITKDGYSWGYEFLNSSPTSIILSTATGSAGSGRLSAQPGVPSLQCHVNNIGGGAFPAYHFFTDGARVNVVMERVTGVFSHLNFGYVEKIGTWAGGAYVTGLYTDESSAPARADLFNNLNSLPFSGRMQTGTPSTSAASGRRGHVRVPVASVGVALLGQQAGTGTYSGYHVASGMQWQYQNEVIDNTPNIFNGRAVLAPISIAVIQSNTIGSNPLRLVGYVPNVALVRNNNLNPGDLVNSDWLVFPISQRNGDASVYMNSATYGIAYQK